MVTRNCNNLNDLFGVICVKNSELFCVFIHTPSKEIEQRGADASTGVAEKLTAFGIGNLLNQPYVLKNQRKGFLELFNLNLTFYNLVITTLHNLHK